MENCDGGHIKQPASNGRYADHKHHSDSPGSTCQLRFLEVEGKNGAFLPTRLLNVGSTSYPFLHLEDTEGRQGRYVTLSHRWGAKLEIASTTANLKDHYVSTNFHELSETLQDAVVATRKLGIPYIWIDSLCIIQDDPEDWRQEAAQMVSIYENEYVTIAATDGDDGSYRFLSQQDSQYLYSDLVCLACDVTSQNLDSCI